MSAQELAETIMDIMGSAGKIEFDRAKTDGAPRKLLDVLSLVQLGWKTSITLVDGIRSAYAEYLNRNLLHLCCQLELGYRGLRNITGLNAWKL